MLNNYGYACINMQLSYPDIYSKSEFKKISTNRTMVKKTFFDKGIQYASELSLKNCRDLESVIHWNKNNGFNFFRVTSNLFPWCSEYNLQELPDYELIRKKIEEIGDFINKNNMRITSHPGPFNVLTSPKRDVVENCIKDLSIHGELFDLMKLSRTPFNKINIHIGGVYGDKKSALDRFCSNFNQLPNNVKSRLTVENDDKATMYSVKDLYEGIYRKIGIPIVFDYHHHRFCNGGLSEKEALDLAVSTWGEIRPVVHYSESRNIEKKDDSIKPQSHSDYVYDYIDTYGHHLDVMIEAKHKELAVLKYLDIHKNRIDV